MAEWNVKQGPLGLGWDKVVTVIVSSAGTVLAFWSGYLIVWPLVMVAYFAGGLSFGWWEEYGDDK